VLFIAATPSKNEPHTLILCDYTSNQLFRPNSDIPHRYSPPGQVACRLSLWKLQKEAISRFAVGGIYRLEKVKMKLGKDGVLECKFNGDFPGVVEITLPSSDVDVARFIRYVTSIRSRPIFTIRTQTPRNVPSPASQPSSFQPSFAPKAHCKSPRPSNRVISHPYHSCRSNDEFEDCSSIQRLYAPNAE
jgi:hypothetical protein